MTLRSWFADPCSRSNNIRRRISFVNIELRKNFPQNLEKSESNRFLKRNIFPSERIASIQFQARIFRLEVCFNGHIEFIGN